MNDNNNNNRKKKLLNADKELIDKYHIKVITNH